MKILFTGYVNSPEYHDPDTWLARIEAYTGILEALAKSHEVMAIEHIAYEGSFERNRVQYYFADFGKNFHKSPARFHRMIRELGPDLVFINGFNFPLRIIQLKLALEWKTKIMVLHRAEHPFRGIKRWIQKIADHCVEAYLFSSGEFAVEWENTINTGKIHEIIQASSVFQITDKQKARNDLGIRHREVFLWVGGLNPGKDPLTVVKGFISFSRKNPIVKLYMIFQTEELLPAIKALIEHENAEGQIELVGKVQHRDLGTWFNAADFYISGSHYEGGGIAVTEAMSCGCIPILTNITSFRRMTGPGKCGFLYEPGNPQSLFENLNAAISIDKVGERKKALRQFHAELSFEAIAKKINCITDSINATRNSTRESQHHHAHVQPGPPHYRNY